MRAGVVNESGKFKVDTFQSYELNNNFEFPAIDDEPLPTSPVKHRILLIFPSSIISSTWSL